MPAPDDKLRQSLLADVTALHSQLDTIWAIAQTLPSGPAKSQLEKTHESVAQLSLNMKRTLMEMV
jgi:hypothetical protein